MSDLNAFLAWNHKQVVDIADGLLTTVRYLGPAFLLSRWQWLPANWAIDRRLRILACHSGSFAILTFTTMIAAESRGPEVGRDLLFYGFFQAFLLGTDLFEKRSRAPLWR